jgi:thymidylate kinase
VAVIIWLNGPFGVGKTTTAEALLRRLPRAVLFDPEPFGTALRHTVANVATAVDFQDLPGWPTLVVETARILREAYAETLIAPLTVLTPCPPKRLPRGWLRLIRMCGGTAW